MKRFLGLFVFVMLLNGCDDGDLTFESIDFDDVSTQRCSGGNILYKINDAETLILEIGQTDAAFQSAFAQEPTPLDTPRTLEIGTSNRLVYRLYNGNVATANICNTIQPATPTVTEEWTATSGTIRIVTTAVLSQNTTAGFEGGQKITGYQHNIVLLNVNFQKPNGTQLYDVFPFGVYTENITPLAFNFADTELTKCPTSQLLFKSVGNEALTLYVSDSALLDTSVLNTPKTGLVGTAANNLSYMTFPTVINAGTFCTAPGTPAQFWSGVDGVPGVSGIVEVVTTTFGSSFKHTIRLKNVTLKKGNSQFLLATDYLYGELITN